MRKTNGMPMATATEKPMKKRRGEAEAMLFGVDTESSESNGESPAPVKKGGRFARKSTSIVIPEIKITEVVVPVMGITPYIAHKWSEKARKMMLDKQMGVAAQKKEKRDPEQDFENAKFIDDDGRDCIPGRQFKGAIVNAASMIEGVTKVSIRYAVWIAADLIPLEYERCEMVEDMTRNANGVADLRYRPYYYDWSVKLPVKLNERLITIPQLVNLINHAGFVGVGDWRPEKNGEFGRFQVDAGALGKKVEPAMKKRK